ncbi:MAG: MMPL family transporter, partial [Gaiellaceae bacterium]
MDWLASLVIRAPGRTVAIVGVLALVAAAFGLSTPGKLGRASNEFVAEGSESLRAEAVVERASGLSPGPQVLVLVRDPSRARVARVSALIRTEPLFQAIGRPILSRDRRAAIIPAFARAGVSQRRWREAAKRVDRRMATVPGTAVGGVAIATVQVSDQVQEDLKRAEAIAFPILFLLALLIFRSVIAALLPLVCGGLAILGSLLLLRVLDRFTPMSPYALNIVTGAGFGLGIDYSLLLVSRYREELARRGPGPDAVRETLRTAGRTVAFSSVTVGAAIATLAVFPLGFLRSMGIAGARVGPLAGAIALTLRPALFCLLGPRIDALAIRRGRPEAQEGGGWYRLAHRIMRHPLPIAF